MASLKERVRQILDEGGDLEHSLDGFAPRQEQLRFAAAVTDALEDETFLLAEAGTGVGKTYAYLIPALLWSAENQTRVVLATKTKALQEQIVDRDLPQLARTLGHPIKYHEAKGRDNYLCWYKYHNIKAGRTRLDPDQIAFLEKILVWAETTKSGDRKELGLGLDLMQHWPIVAADRFTCQREMCGHQERCFRIKMLKAVAKTDLIVTNHALLLTDLMMEGSILPEYDRLIIDEAHNFNKESFDQLALKFEFSDTLHLVQRLILRDKRSRRGYIQHLIAHHPELKEELEETSSLAHRLLSATGTLFACLDTGLAKEKDPHFARIISDEDRDSAWLVQFQDLYRREWKPLWEALYTRIGNLARAVEDGEEAAQLANIYEALRQTDEVSFTILVEKLYDRNSLSWVEFIDGHAAVICAAELGSSRILEQKLYQRLKTLVMVSATLTVEDTFDSVIERCGLSSYADSGKVQLLQEHSPFDYRQQAALYLVDDMAEPGSAGFMGGVTKVLQRIFLEQRGQIMVLFTSRKQMEEADRTLRPLCETQGLTLLVQNTDGDFTSLVEGFSRQTNTILMGLETFWEGIDLKGEVLKYLIIVKLPFRSPSDPYCSAWEQHYGRQGKSSFAHFLLPDAALRFKQGVGRLIRSENDHGAVVVLDSRLVSKGYGRVFRRSIPIQEIQAVHGEDVSTHLRRWA